ncbi:iron-containing redox enzyme family protein [Massilia sp. PWRC2]|uniref:iron-containing redox enzyme family protein n=1 Tax=Massilia sp. PWRC2 TaxID=2804626 RepID=UPI003CEA0E10
MTAHIHHPWRLSAGCTIRSGLDGVVLDTREDSITIASNQPAALAAWLAQLQTGTAPLAAPAALADLCAQLREADLLLEIDGAVNARDSDALVLAFEREARFWARAIFEQPFWVRLLAGDCTSAQVFGWGTEFYHFVDAANLYMPIGVAHSGQTRSLRPALARHYVEEMNHGEIFLAGLRQSGIDSRSVQLAPALPQTAALINNLTELAYEGGVAYAACFAVMQPGLSTGTAAELEHFYRSLTALYPYAGEMFAAFHKHASMDLLLEHAAPPFFALCREEPALSPQARRRASAVMQSVAESFILFFEGIHDAYADSGAFAPRRPFALEAVQ